MSAAEIPTFLGGDYANLAWEDLNPHELIEATVSSMVRAETAFRYASAQAEAAHAQTDITQEINYREASRVLASMTGRTPTELTRLQVNRGSA